MKSLKPLISVYITNHNYEKYLKQSIESVLNQSYTDFELIIIDDASADNSVSILDSYSKNPKIKIIKNKISLGLVASAKKAIEKSSGKYIMRLDSDDWLDENALLVMSKILDIHKEIGLVYPDYFETDQYGNIVSHIRRKKVDTEVELLDLPAHGACTMIRRKCYDDIGGYSKDITRQDGYDLWLKFIRKFKPMNVNLPLFYYRRHGDNLTEASKLLLQTRRTIKKKAFERLPSNKRKLNILGIIPTRSHSSFMKNLPLTTFAGKPLISYSINALIGSNLNKVVVVSEDETLLKIVKQTNTQVDTIHQPPELAKTGTRIEKTINYTLKHYKKNGFKPDLVVLLYVTSPLVTSSHVTEAIQTLALYNADSVISVRENRIPHYRHERHGLVALEKDQILKHERDILFESTGSLLVTKASLITSEKMIGKTLGHILLTEDEAVDINNRFEWWLAENILTHRKELNEWINKKT